MKRIGFLFPLLVLVACEKKPEAELNKAREAVKALEDAGAPQYAPEEFQNLKSSLEDAEAKIAKRQYRQAKDVLLKIIADAPRVESIVKQKKEEEERRKAQEAQQAPEAATPATPTAPQQ